MTCQHCRPIEHRRYLDEVELSASHAAAGIRQTRCPECGLPLWPWEFPPHVLLPSGLRWVPSPAGARGSRSWWLHRGARTVGRVYRHHSCQREESRRTWQAVYWGPEIVGVWVVHRGGLRDCARALVLAVRATAPNV